MLSGALEGTCHTLSMKKARSGYPWLRFIEHESGHSIEHGEPPSVTQNLPSISSRLRPNQGSSTKVIPRKQARQSTSPPTTRPRPRTQHACGGASATFIRLFISARPQAASPPYAYTATRICALALLPGTSVGLHLPRLRVEARGAPPHCRRQLKTTPSAHSSSGAPPNIEP